MSSSNAAVDGPDLLSIPRRGRLGRLLGRWMVVPAVSKILRVGDAFETLKSGLGGGIDLLFLGDSITDFWRDPARGPASRWRRRVRSWCRPPTEGTTR